ncbi:hypothetical protein [Bacillus sp. S/N-304-OC-R1]|uniref:hypothetical protein n=1 Tax=Bacillus sp. S/N-304-OC-R1 TaxID=2758034 RepID=UPI001C8D044D|nr:hypothetical protein [Bacillus sp. S/N-304-OC-R1]MBY0122040.1 hypothetical protein [Bacillus sp. S/N-304-OC-R1]
MCNEQFNDVMDELKSLPKPELHRQAQKEMLDEIQLINAKHHNRKKWGIRLQRSAVGVMSAAAIITLSILGFTLIEGNKDSVQHHPHSQLNSSEHQAIIDQSSHYDSVLEEHQMALDDLFVWIPERKGTVQIDRKVENGFIIAEVKDKETNELLYTYGESLDGGDVKSVFREIPLQHTKVRIQAMVEVNPENYLISGIENTSASFNPQPFRVEGEDRIFSASRSNEYPTQEAEVLASMTVYKSKTEIEGNLYEGFTIGVINKGEK